MAGSHTHLSAREDSFAPAVEPSEASPLTLASTSEAGLPEQFAGRVDGLGMSSTPLGPTVSFPTATSPSSPPTCAKGTPACRPVARTRRGPGQRLPSSRLHLSQQKPSRLSAKTWPGGLRTFRDPPTLPPHARQGKPTAAATSPPSLALYAPTILISRGA